MASAGRGNMLTLSSLEMKWLNCGEYMIKFKETEYILAFQDPSVNNLHISCRSYNHMHFEWSYKEILVHCLHRKVAIMGLWIGCIMYINS